MAAPSSEIAKGFQVRQHFYNSLPILDGICGATIAVGDVLEETSGIIQLADHDDTTTIIGVAVSSATSTNRVRYVPCWSGIIFEGTMSDDGTASQALVVGTMKYQQFGLGIDAGNLKPYINLAETTSIVLTVTDFVDAVGATFGRVLFSFLPNKTVWGV